MRYGETGINLEIDLSRGSIEKEESDPKLAEDFLGGRGTGAKILWDRVPPEVEAFSPDNLLIFDTGFLQGTPSPGANRITVTTIIPINNFASFGVMGAFWGSELKHAGYDRIIIRGKSPTPVYLWIHNDKVELRDASHLWGTDIGTLEMEDIIREELNEKAAQVAVIGTAGENRVYGGSIESDGSSASYGFGSVMGDKKLKAIVVRGTKKDVNIARPAELFKFCEEMMTGERTFSTWEIAHTYPKTGKSWEGIAHARQARTRVENFPEIYGLIQDRTRDGVASSYDRKADVALWDELTIRQTKGCYNCPAACKAVISDPEYGICVVKCANATTGMRVEGGDRRYSLQLYSLYEKYGFGMESGAEFALKLLKNGVLTDEDFPGMPSDHKGARIWLTHKIAHREGIGDILANGVSEAARMIGKGAEEYDDGSIKNLPQVGALGVYKFNPTYFLLYVTGDKCRTPQVELWFPQKAPEIPKEEREEYIEKWWDLPERFKKWFLEYDERKMKRTDPEAINEAAALVTFCVYVRQIMNSLGLCAYWAGHDVHPPWNMWNMAEAVSYVTGREVDEPELERIGNRIDNLARAYNVRRGLNRTLEHVSKRGYIDKQPELEVKTLDEYYKLRGWNAGGIPTRETLEELDLGYVADDLERRGLLSEELALDYRRQDIERARLLAEEAGKPFREEELESF